jgi:hypothetical protein
MTKIVTKIINQDLQSHWYQRSQLLKTKSYVQIIIHIYAQVVKLL